MNPAIEDAIYNNNVRALMYEVSQQGIGILEKPDEYGRTPCFLAASEGRNDILEYLVSNRAGINIRDMDGMTPLMIAAASGHRAAVDILLGGIKATDINIDETDDHGMSAILWAARNGHFDIVDALVSKGAKIDYGPDGNAKEIVFCAAAHGANKNLAEMLKQACFDFDETNQLSGDTLFMTAVRHGQIDTAKIILQHAFNPQMITASGNRYSGELPIVVAAQYGHEEMFKFLHKAGADINAVDGFGRTPLIAAAMAGRTDLVKLAVEKGADIEARDNDGMSPLIAAAMTGDTKMIAFLLKNGAGLRAKAGDGMTPVIAAVLSGKVAAVKLLYSQGDMNNEKYQNMSLQQLARKNGVPQVISFLEYQQRVENYALRKQKNDAVFPVEKKTPEVKKDESAPQPPAAKRTKT